MLNANKVIPQTHRAILFDIFNDDKDSLSNIINLAAGGSISADDRDLMIKELEVKNFDEFLQKFSPVIYEYCGENPDGSMYFEYRLKKYNDGDQVPEIKIANHEYFKTLVKLYEKRGDSGQSRYEFDYDNILETLLPESEAKRIESVRKQLGTLIELYAGKKEKHEDASEENKQLKKFRREIIATYSKSDLALLPIRIGDINSQIEDIDRHLNRNDKREAAGNSDKTLQIGSFAFDENIHQTCIPLQAPKPATASASDEQLPTVAKTRQALIQRIGQDYDKTKGPDAKAGIKALVVAAYTPQVLESGNALASKTTSELEEIRADLERQARDLNKIYASAKNAFIEAMQVLAAKMLNVKVFFDHAIPAGASKLEGDVGLIVSNCSAADLIEDDAKSKAFVDALSTFNANPMEKIWFGILPNVEEDEAEDQDFGDGDALNDDLDADEDTVSSKRKVSEKIKLTDAMKFLGIMNEDRVCIVTVFNFAPDKMKNSFGSLTPEYITATKARLRSLSNNGHAVLAYPNFTLMTKRYKVMPDVDKKSPQDNQADCGIKIDDIYVGAAYVAAGLLVRSQQKDTFKTKELWSRMLPENPNVRIDLESDEIVDNISPRFSREMVLNWSTLLKQAINDGSFGFVFCGDPRFNKSKDEYLKNIYVHFARTLRISGNSYQPIYTTLVKDFILSYVHAFGKVNKAIIKEFLRNHVPVWREQAKRDPEMINLILPDGEDIVQDENDSGKLMIKFGQTEDIIPFRIEEIVPTGK